MNRADIINIFVTIVIIVTVMKNVTLYKVSRVVIQLITVEQCEE